MAVYEIILSNCGSAEGQVMDLGNMRMGRHMRTLTAACLLALLPMSVTALVNLEWRPGISAVCAGEQVTVGLYAVSDSQAAHTVSAMDVVMLWDAGRLSAPVLGAKQPYWLSDGFFQASPGGINTSLEDGDAMYTAWANFGAPVEVTNQGLLCVQMTFTAQPPAGLTLVQIVPSFGQYSQTRVFDGSSPNTDIKGALGAAQILVFPSEASTSAAEARQMDDDSLVKLAGPVVTRRFDSIGCFYVEDADRAAGIRVDCAPESIPNEGDAPVILGTIRTVDGERIIEAASVTAGGQAAIVAPLGMTPGRVGIGLSPQGLLVRAWGQVLSDGDEGIVLNDGSGQELRVELHGVEAPRIGNYVGITGAMGADAAGPVLRVNNSADIVTYAAP